MTSFMKEYEHLRIQLEEIKRATNSFCNKAIGAGGFGAVYEGEVSHSTGRSIVAMKRLNRQFGQGDPEFLKEIMMLSRYTHPNLISLLGFCDDEQEKVLVYEYASKGSLDRHLSDPDLTWAQRIKICIGAAKGLCYLHDPKEKYQRVLHCDIKSANILLDENMNAKVADFGLSKMGPANQQDSVIVTDALGTVGYCDPVYMRTFTLTKESDVYSFGVVLFEVLCGRLCYQHSNGKVFVDMWKEKFLDKKLNEIVFQHLKPQMNPASLELFSEVAFQCLHNSREGRPTMSNVVDKLEKALESQVFYGLKLSELYAAVPPLRFTSIDDLNYLFSNGVFLNAGKTWFSRNDQGEHYVLISIAECLIPNGSDAPEYSTGYNSRFEVGCYSTYGKAFKTHVKTQCLSPLVTYRVNLVFKFKKSDKSYKKDYLFLKYTLNGETRVSVVHCANKREDEWLKATLYQLISHGRTVDLEIDFKIHQHSNGLEIEGIEFQPLEKVEVEFRRVLKYGEILKAAAHPLTFKSEAELDVLLSKGILLNEGKTWFSRNNRGVHYVLVSIQECLIQEAGKTYRYVSGYNSRFPEDPYYATNCSFKTHVKTEFLSPHIMYTVNLIFKFESKALSKRELGNICLGYKLNGESYSQVSHLAYERKDEWWAVELYHFTSDGTAVDLEIIFESGFHDIIVDGIQFRPVEEVELKALKEDKKPVNVEPILSDSKDDTYWETKLPAHYKDIIKFSKQSLQWKTNKEIYYLLSEGLLINYKPFFSFSHQLTNHPFSSFSQRLTNHGRQWFYVDKNGKTCLMLPARAICKLENPNKSIKAKLLQEWMALPESRFGEGLVSSSSNAYKYIVIKENKFRVLSPRTKYACYLIYKSERGGYTSPMRVWHRKWGEWVAGTHIYLVSPQIPVIKPKAGQNTHNPRYRPELKGIPKQRSDGWMEVQVWEFQTDTTDMTVIPSLRLRYNGMYAESHLKGLNIIGIEFRPI